MPKVIILGGGVAGMSAAHELIERNYEVEIYEYNPDYVGGKARSVNYFGKDKQYENPLPGEHGFRFFPGFYKHVTDTMKRIPFKTADGKIQSVYDNLTSTLTTLVTQYDKPPIVTLASFPKSFKELRLAIQLIRNDQTDLTREEKVFFATRVWQLMTSCRERRYSEYESLGVWEYFDADHFSSTYQNLLVNGLTRTLVASKARLASTKTGGDILLQLLFTTLDPSLNTDRILNGPTNEKWLFAWNDYLTAKGVKINQGWVCTGFEADISTQTIKSVKVTKIDKATRKPTQETLTLTADHYIMAMPVERAAEVISEEMITCDATLTSTKILAQSVAWMNGIQFYLNQNVEINNGHIIFSDTEYALTAISQVQFWKDYDLSGRGNGKIKGLLSVDISDWFKEGFFNKKAANNCTKQEVADEVWAELKKSLNRPGNEILKDEMLEDFYLDRDIHLRDSETEFPSVYDNTNGMLVDREPLLVNRINTWTFRPEANCEISNLFFASDYVRTNTDLATMEGANEAARRAVNCILDVDSSTAEKCEIWDLTQPWYLKPIKWYDSGRVKQGLPWTIHAPLWIKILTVIGAIIYFISGIIIAFLFPKRK